MLTDAMPRPRFPDVGEGAPKILFVCTGNTCRSPMAAALFNDMARARQEQGGKRAVAASAGLYATTGAPITEEAAQALLEAGVESTPDNDYRNHRAACVSEEMMAAADEVVAISGRHAMELLMRYPAHATKITTLGTDVPDPFGGELAVYRDCLCTLRALIAARYFGEGEAV